MGNCISYCSSELLDHELINCEAYVEGAAPAIVIGSCSSDLTDPSDGVAILAEIAAGRARLINNVRVDIPLPSAIFADSPVGGGSQIPTTYDRTINLFDANVTADNVDFYNQIKNDRIGYIIVKEYGADRVTFISPTNGLGIKFSGGRIIPATKTEFQRFELVGAWSEKDDAGIFPTPAGVFS
jgi:hypothetical protein